MLVSSMAFLIPPTLPISKKMPSIRFGVRTFLFVPLAFFLTGNDLLHAQQTDKKTEVVIEDPRIGLIQGIALDDQGRIYVGDVSNLKVHRYLESESMIAHSDGGDAVPGSSGRYRASESGPLTLFTCTTYDHSALQFSPQILIRNSEPCRCLRGQPSYPRQ